MKTQDEAVVGSTFECGNCHNNIRLYKCTQCGKKFAVCYHRDKSGDFSIGCGECGNSMIMNIPAPDQYVINEKNTYTAQAVKTLFETADTDAHTHGDGSAKPVRHTQRGIPENVFRRPSNDDFRRLYENRLDEIAQKKYPRNFDDYTRTAPEKTETHNALKNNLRETGKKLSGGLFKGFDRKRLVLFGLWPLAVVPVSAMAGFMKKTVNQLGASPGGIISSGMDSILLSTAVFLYLYIARTVFLYGSGKRYMKNIFLFSLLAPFAVRMLLDLFYTIPNLPPVIFFALLFPVYCAIAVMVIFSLTVVSGYPFIRGDDSIYGAMKNFLRHPGDALIAVAVTAAGAALSGVLFQFAYKIIIKIVNVISFSGAGDLVSASFASLWTPYRILASIDGAGSLVIALIALMLWSFLFTAVLAAASIAGSKYAARSRI